MPRECSHFSHGHKPVDEGYSTGKGIFKVCIGPVTEVKIGVGNDMG